MLVSSNPQRVAKILLAYKIAYHKHRAALLDDARQVLQSHRRVCALALRLEGEQLPDYPQYMLTSLLRRDEFFYDVGEEDDTNLVVVADGGERQTGGNLCHKIAFGGLLGA